MVKKKSFDNFNHLNIYLIESFLDIEYIEYVELIQHSLFKNMKIQLIKYLLLLNDQNDDFCIDEDILTKYQLIKNKDDILNLINYNQLINDIDYRIRKTINKDTNSFIYDYKFKQQAFKKCLLRHDILYCDIYLMLEKCTYYFNKYQNNLKKNLNEVINLKLDNIQSELKNINKH